MQRRHAAASDAAGGGWEKSDAPSIEALEAPPVKRPAVPPLRRGARGLKGKKARRPRDPNFEPGGPPLAAVVVFALLAFGVLGYHLYCHHYVPDALPISSVVANDLHGIHDLLTAGAAGVFLLDGDRAVVVEAAERLAKLLPQIHPLAECRAAIGDAVCARRATGTGPTAASPPRSPRRRARPGPASPAPSTRRPSTASSPSRPGASATSPTRSSRGGRRSRTRASLGACRPSSWDRACSFWVSLHALAARADAKGLQDAFLDSTTKLLAGGATQCAACTNHFRLLATPPHGKLFHPFLFDAVHHDLAYCANVQCSRATQHIVPLADCARNDRPCQTPGMEAEKRDIYAFRQWIKSRKHVSAWDTYVVLHNLVTDGLLSGDVKRFECADRAYDALPAFLTPDAPRKPRVKAGGGVAGSLPPGVALPGVGPHRLLACADL
ncbi:hypothetical protein JL722_13326 [Aureococcus anophagefferens]|nr:hypothetical protein JL722_13326 [Aureococcus anophagefferens]